jgi:hypothetical protein
MNANLAADAPLQVNFTPALQILHAVVLLDLEDAVDRADFQAGLAAGAIVGVDDGQLFGQFFAGALFGHCEESSNVRALGRPWLPGRTRDTHPIIESDRQAANG